MNENIILDISNEKYKYKGILSAIIDNKAVAEMTHTPVGFFGDDVAEVFVIIYQDECENWIWKGRIKFPSGNKQVIQNNMGKNSNETACLHDIYKLPLSEKQWFKNPCQTGYGLLDIMRKNDLILSITKVKIND